MSSSLCSLAAQELSQLGTAQTDENAEEQIKNKISELEQASTTISEEIETIRQRITVTQSEITEARAALAKAEAARSEFKTESTMLENLLRDESSGQFKPVLDELTAESGFEKAISRALGDALLASLEGDAPARWMTRTNLHLSGLPLGAMPLLKYLLR